MTDGKISVSSSPTTTGMTQSAIEQARALLESDPAAAVEQARQLLAASPGDLSALRFLAEALRQTGNGAEAERVEAEFVAGSAQAPEYQEAARAISAGDSGRATVMLEQLLASDGDLTPELLSDRSGQGCPAADPIFIVGIQRSGSTLVEQMLASHPQVEGTAQLSDLGNVVRQLGTDAERRKLHQPRRSRPVDGNRPVARPPQGSARPDDDRVAAVSAPR